MHTHTQCVLCCVVSLRIFTFGFLMKQKLHVLLYTLKIEVNAKTKDTERMKRSKKKKI